ncbi:MAG TPA: hypothetical protein VLH59_00065, partial [Ignavibacteriaceae bacterium]|nr:hypothetical protein [Ignavibacteriaceae bacterium]
MKTKILGYRYKFIVELEKKDNNYSFEILSSYNSTQQNSTITNVNFIISELIYDITQTTDIDTTLYINKIDGVKLFRKSVSFFNDKSWIKSLEKAL